MGCKIDALPSVSVSEVFVAQIIHTILYIQDGGAAGVSVHPAEGAARPAAHPVRPGHLRQAELQSGPQPDVPGLWTQNLSHLIVL